ncbi:MAG: hypothetical protein ACTSWC_05650 [Promethearchaeota archaeon]
MSEILEKYLIISFGLLLNLMFLPFFFPLDYLLPEFQLNDFWEKSVKEDSSKLEENLNRIENSSINSEFNETVQLSFCQYGTIEGYFEKKYLEITFFFYIENFSLFQKYVFKISKNTKIYGLNNSVTTYTAGISNSIGYIHFK